MRIQLKEALASKVASYLRQFFSCSEFWSSPYLHQFFPCSGFWSLAVCKNEVKAWEIWSCGHVGQGVIHSPLPESCPPHWNLWTLCEVWDKTSDAPSKHFNHQFALALSTIFSKWVWAASALPLSYNKCQLCRWNGGGVPDQKNTFYCVSCTHSLSWTTNSKFSASQTFMTAVLGQTMQERPQNRSGPSPLRLLR